MGKLILFYKYIYIKYPKQIQKWQLKICTDLNLKGRIILAHEGINATLAGEQLAIDLYIKLMNEHELFGGIDFKESEGSSDYFPRLRIVVKDEIVRFGKPWDMVKAEDAGTHLTPEQAHSLIQNKPDNLIVFDARNNYESHIGTFNNAITPDIGHFRDLPEYIDNNIAQFKDKQVLMFCTGGIRCERASAYLKEKGVAQEVYQLQGGIQRYVEQYPDGYFRGKNYVFDGRVSVRVTNDILSKCLLCQKPCDDYTNCMNASCNKHFTVCNNCFEANNQTCSQQCKELLITNKVALRPPLQKVKSESCNV